MDIELLYFEDCPNWQVAAALLDEVAAERDDIVLRRRLVTTDEEAQRLRFYGSPSIHANGRDLFEPPVGSEPGLSCRVYKGDDGLSGSPSIEQLRVAIEALAGPDGG